MANKANTKDKGFKTKTFNKCFFCGGKIIPKYTGLRDRFDTTTVTFTAAECIGCQAAFLNPMPTGDVGMFYPDHYLSGEDEAKKSGGFDFEKWYRYNQYRYDFKLLKKATGKDLGAAESYVDIGCGSGERVNFAKEQGCKRAYGVDKFDFAKNESKREIKIVNSEILDYKPSKKFEVASLFHVLEHIETPRETLEHIRKNILASGGSLIVQVPNYDSFERRIFKSRWFSFDVPRHIWQFNARVVIDLLQEAGFTVNKAYMSNAPLHPVTIVPSIHRELDIQRIWVKDSKGSLYKRGMTLLWAGLTVVTIPVTVFQNIFKKSSMLTVVATKK